ncbi:MAG: TrkH family potassium uptake protein [DPANN group archaeon]|nr:TrkH family potassium uptake protein [DPANN group archaeon]
MGLLLEIFSIFLIIPITVAFLYNEPTTPFFITLTISILLGVLLEKSFKREELTLGRGIALTALSFVVFSLLGSIPFGFLIENMHTNTNIIDPLFESVSGFTTTGLTIFKSVEILPKSILFWRSMTQWLGGMGIIIIFLSLLRGLPTSSIALYQAQGLPEKTEPSINQTTKVMLKIYLTYTILGIIALYLAGLNLFDATNTTFTAISTGGFAVVDTFYDNNLILGIISILMLLGSINFILHDKLFKKRFKEFIESIEVKSFSIFLLTIITLTYISTGMLKISIFEMISTLTATGFSITNISLLGAPIILIMIISMIVGSFAGSTAGGIKQLRFFVSIKSTIWTIQKFISPKNAIIPFKIGKTVVDEDTIKVTQIFVITYLGILVLGTIMLSFSGYSLEDSLFQAASAQGTVGLNTVPIHDMPLFGKITLICMMLLGRLEIFPIFILIKKSLEKF